MRWVGINVERLLKPELLIESDRRVTRRKVGRVEIKYAFCELVVSAYESSGERWERAYGASALCGQARRFRGELSELTATRTPRSCSNLDMSSHERQASDLGFAHQMIKR